MAKRKPNTMYAMVDCSRVLMPIEQLGMFESCMRVESAYENGPDGKYTTNYWISEIPKLPNVELVTQDQVTAWQVTGKLRVS